MRPDLPWNVAGISSEAREAARAAARREGLSLGEWLTRRIVSGLSEISEPAIHHEWTGRTEYRPQPERPYIQAEAKQAETMLEHVSRSETETAEVYRRIEEQLRGMTRRLDTSERNQTENSRVMSKAAVEMNIAAREQAQAFDQLGSHVANLADRLEKVEERDPGEGLRDAVKALHSGLSRLADQIAQTANQSASQVSNLANSIETVAGRIGQARQDAMAATQALESRLGAFDERVRHLEAASQVNAGSIDRALEAIEAQKRAPSPLEAITRLEDSVRRLEERGADPVIDKRLSGIERSLADVVDRIECRDDPAPALQDNLRKVAARLEALETAQREAAAELRKAAVAASKPVEEPPTAPSAATPAPQPVAHAAHQAAFGPLPSFEPPPFAAEVPPFADPPSASVPPPFAAPFAVTEHPEPPLTYELPPGPGMEERDSLSGAAMPGITAEAPTTVESYLAAARRSARAAAQQESERTATLGALRWGSNDKPAESGPHKRTKPLLAGLAVLIALFAIIALVMSRQGIHLFPSHPVPAAADNKTKPPAKSGVPDIHPSAVDGQIAPLPPTPQTGEPAESAAAKPGVRQAAAQPPGPQPQTPQSGLQTAQAAHPAPSTAPLDRLTLAANAGNTRAQLVVGLKYLDGSPVNEVEAAKWLIKAANAGEPVAQYRMGTLFERGRGVAADPVKAVRWYLAAANQGSCKAMHNLAVAYAEGTGVKKDYAEASRWFLRAANLGLSDSQFNLAVLYERGLGVPQNLVDAYKWYAIAAAQGDVESKGRMNAIASQLDAEARAAAQQAADSFKPGHLNAYANVAPTVADITRGR